MPVLKMGVICTSFYEMKLKFKNYHRLNEEGI